MYISSLDAGDETSCDSFSAYLAKEGLKCSSIFTCGLSRFSELVMAVRTLDYAFRNVCESFPSKDW